nr:MAG TPA: hypothetical protein [Bacteriophage sp.]
MAATIRDATAVKPESLIPIHSRWFSLSHFSFSCWFLFSCSFR